MDTKKISLKDVSAANLPDKFKIKNPREYIQKMRSNYLKNLRKRMGLSNEEVAKQCDIDVKDLNQIESGVATTNNMMDLHALSDFYKIDYHKVLSLYKLLEHRPENDRFGLAASYNQEIDKETRKELEAFIEKFKE